MNRVRKQRIRRSLIAVAGAAALAALAGAGQTAPADAATATVNHDIHVFAANLGQGTGAHTTISQLASTMKVDGFSPDMIMLSEFCHGQLGAFTANPEFHGWHYTYTQMMKIPGCGTDQGKGELLASPHALSNVTVEPLPRITSDRPIRHYHLTCAAISIPGAKAGSVRGCVTHLQAGNNPTNEGTEHEQLRIRQDHDINLQTRPIIAKGTKVILAGDFNNRSRDSALNSIYSLDVAGHFTGPGSFVESDQTDGTWFGQDPNCQSTHHCRSGQPTVGIGTNPRRYDYIFYSSDNSVNYDLHGWALNDGGSDHRAVRSTATLPLPRS